MISFVSKYQACSQITQLWASVQGWVLLWRQMWRIVGVDLIIMFREFWGSTQIKEPVTVKSLSIEIIFKLSPIFTFQQFHRVSLQILSLDKQVSSDQPSSVQVRKSSVPQPSTASSLRKSVSDSPLPPPTPPPPLDASTLTLQQRDGEPYSATPPRSMSNLSTCISSSQKHLPHRESTPSLASDISLPFATLELQQRLRQLQK